MSSASGPFTVQLVCYYNGVFNSGVNIELILSQSEEYLGNL
jgi:hypothetical protein